MLTMAPLRAGKMTIKKQMLIIMVIGKGSVKQNGEVRNTKVRHHHVDDHVNEVAIGALLGRNHVNEVRREVSGHHVKEVVIATQSLKVGNVVGPGSVAGVAVVKRNIDTIGMSETNATVIGISEIVATIKNDLKRHVIGHVNDIAIDVAVVVIAEVDDERKHCFRATFWLVNASEQLLCILVKNMQPPFIVQAYRLCICNDT